MAKKLRILGTRGIPAQHGGFETFAERLALYLVERGWDVTVYCQVEGRGTLYEGIWHGVHLVHIPVNYPGAAGTIFFDWKSTFHAAQRSGVILTLGYNTAIFSAVYRLRNIPNIINMDGIEWKRRKWSLPERAWLYLNERLGCWFGNHLIADHPEIKAHLAARVAESKITMIPYGSDSVVDADSLPIEKYGLKKHQYCLVIARFEPENSILEMVKAFSQKVRGIKLVLLGRFDPDNNEYHKKLRDAASGEIFFLGAIYDSTVVKSLRFYCRLYLHGHTVGGTNPSLVEALGASSPILAHDNKFNRWVAGEGAHYFRDTAECSLELDALLDNDEELERMKELSLKRHSAEFTWESILSKYELLLKKW